VIPAKQVKQATRVKPAQLAQPAIQAQPAQLAQLAPQDKSDYKGRKETPVKLVPLAKPVQLALQDLPVIPVLLDKQVLRAQLEPLALEA
jgi:hypothetical protein